MNEGVHSLGAGGKLVTASPLRTQWVLEGVGWRLERHDRDRIELKLQYAPPPKGGRARYRVDLFFFIPPNLGINPRHYAKEDFYEDLQTYMRYRAPALTLGGLADFESESHPLAPVVAWADRAAPSDKPQDTGRLVHALKLYGAALTESMDEERKFLYKQTLGGPSAEPRLVPSEVLVRIRRFMGDIDRNLAALRRLRTVLLQPRMDPQIGTALAAVDEYLSLEAEEALFKIIGMLDRRSSEGTALAEQARELIRREGEYRAGLGLPSRVSPDADDSSNEAYQYRRGVLKKFAASSLFLNLHGSKISRRIKEVVAAVAAGLAMTFALLVAVASVRYTAWGVYSTQWIVVAVVAYIFKDRIKEWTQVLGANQLSRWLSDRRGILHDESQGKRIGTVCETHRYVHADRLEQGIRRIRMADPFSRLELEHADEWVMCYTRDIHLRGNGLDTPLTDILRYGFDRYTKRMDDPLEPVPVLIDGEVGTVLTPRIYRVNLVLRITNLQQGPGSSVQAFVRVILTSKGIRRLEFAG